jgi:hypothetical protein
MILAIQPFQERTRQFQDIVIPFPQCRHAQQRGLRLGRQGIHLVEEEGTPVGLADQAGGLGFRVGESAATVAEQLAFDGVFRQGAAIDRHEGCRSASSTATAWPAGGGRMHCAAVSESGFLTGARPEAGWHGSHSGRDVRRSRHARFPAPWAHPDRPRRRSTRAARRDRAPAGFSS